MASEGLTFEDALVDVISKRSCIAPNRGFCDQLRILQDQCGNRLEDYRNDMIQVGIPLVMPVIKTGLPSPFTTYT